MKCLKIMLLLTVITVLAVGCGGSKTKQVAATDDAIDNIPEWFKNPPVDPNYVYGRGTHASKDMQIALDNASESGRHEVAKTLEDKFTGMTKKFQEEVGLASDAEILKQFTNATKSVVSQVMIGCKSHKNEILNENGVFRVFTLMELPLGEANLALYNQTKANQNMYTRFRATEAWKELENEVEKYEAWKATQAGGATSGQ
jgi:hypothetical protein